MPQLIALLRAASIALLLLCAATAGAQDGPPRVVAVNYPLAHFAERLAGAEADVALPVPDGADPAFWRPSIPEIQAIQSADLILLNGAGFASWTERVSLPRSRIVDTSRGFADRFIATEAVTHSHGPDGEHSHMGTASHTWLDQMQALAQADAVADALVGHGIATREAIAPRRAALEADLQALDAAGRRLSSLARDAVLIATHPRYQYLARAYGLTIHALDWEAGAAPSAAQLEELEALAAATGATVLLWEAAPPEEARAAVRALGLADAVFPTFAMPVEGRDYVAGLKTAFDELAAALGAGG